MSHKSELMLLRTLVPIEDCALRTLGEHETLPSLMHCPGKTVPSVLLL